MLNERSCLLIARILKKLQCNKLCDILQCKLVKNDLHYVSMSLLVGIIIFLCPQRQSSTRRAHRCRGGRQDRSSRTTAERFRARNAALARDICTYSKVSRGLCTTAQTDRTTG